MQVKQTALSLDRFQLCEFFILDDPRTLSLFQAVELKLCAKLSIMLALGLALIIFLLFIIEMLSTCPYLIIHCLFALFEIIIAKSLDLAQKLLSKSQFFIS